MPTFGWKHAVFIAGVLVVATAVFGLILPAIEASKKLEATMPVLVHYSDVHEGNLHTAYWATTNGFRLRHSSEDFGALVEANRGFYHAAADGEFDLDVEILDRENAVVTIPAQAGWTDAGVTFRLVRLGEWKIEEIEFPNAAAVIPVASPSPQATPTMPAAVAATPEPRPWGGGPLTPVEQRR